MSSLNEPGSAPPAIRAIFDGYPQLVRKRLLTLRELILETAETEESVGGLEEGLRWANLPI